MTESFSAEGVVDRFGVSSARAGTPGPGAVGVDSTARSGSSFRSVVSYNFV